MSASLKITDAASFQAYARKFENQLLSRMYLGFPTASLATPHANVKGQLPLTEVVLGNLVQRWNSNFNDTANAIEFQPRILSTSLVKIDLQIYPQEFEGSYLGQMMKPGQNPTELPFQAYVLDKVLAKKNEECENAVWNGDEAGSPAEGDLVAAVINGFKTIAKDAATATTITAVTTGALSDTNAVAAFENVYQALGNSTKQSKVTIFCTRDAQAHYIRDYRTRYGASNITSEYMQFDLGDVDWFIIPGTGDFIMMTPAMNLHYGFDAESDGTTIRFENNHRAIDMMMDFRIGVQFGILDDTMVRINDQ